MKAAPKRHSMPSGHVATAVAQTLSFYRPVPHFVAQRIAAEAVKATEKAVLAVKR